MYNECEDRAKKEWKSRTFLNNLIVINDICVRNQHGLLIFHQNKYKNNNSNNEENKTKEECRKKKLFNFIFLFFISLSIIYFVVLLFLLAVNQINLASAKTLCVSNFRIRFYRAHHHHYYHSITYIKRHRHTQATYTITTKQITR